MRVQHCFEVYGKSEIFSLVILNEFCFRIVAGMLMNETGKIEGSFAKVGQFFNSCLEFEEKPVDFTPGEYSTEL